MEIRNEIDFLGHAVKLLNNFADLMQFKYVSKSRYNVLKSSAAANF